jgi:hypothetical protein
MKPPSVRRTAAYHVRALSRQVQVLWWEVLEAAEGWWERHVCAADPFDAWQESSYVRGQIVNWYGKSRITMTAGQNDAEIIDNLLSDPRSFAGKELIW